MGGEEFHVPKLRAAGTASGEAMTWHTFVRIAVCCMMKEEKLE